MTEIELGYEREKEFETCKMKKWNFGVLTSAHNCLCT